MFATILVSMTDYLIYWGLGYTHYSHLGPFLLTTFSDAFTAPNIGGNNIANLFGASVSSGTLTTLQALLIAAMFEVSGVVITSGGVTDTVHKGTVNLSTVNLEPIQSVYIMMSALLAAALWLLFASCKSLPVSTARAIIGGIVGSILYVVMTADVGASAMIRRGKLDKIVVSWMLLSVLGSAVSLLILSQIRKYVLDYNVWADGTLRDIKREKKVYKERHRLSFERLSGSERVECATKMACGAQTYDRSDPRPEELQSDYYHDLYELDSRKNSIDSYKTLCSWVPSIASIDEILIPAMLILKELKSLQLGMSNVNSSLTIFMIGAAVRMGTFVFTKNLKREGLGKSIFQVFPWMQVLTAYDFAFSHNTNGIASAISPFAVVMGMPRTGSITGQNTMPSVTMLAFGIAPIAGLRSVSKEVIKTIGSSLTAVYPASGFTTGLFATAVVMAVSFIDLPISSTHVLIGAVLGVDLVNRDTNWALMKPIGLAWIVMLPAATVLAVVCYLILQAVF